MKKQGRTNNLHHKYSKEQLERKALKILNEYENGKMLNKPSPLDVDEFAEFHLGLTIDFANLSSDCLTLGCMCFYDGKLEVWDDNREHTHYIDVSQGTLYIDNQALAFCSKERTNFTIMHECAHWILHKRFYFRSKKRLMRDRIIVYKSDDVKLKMTDDEVKEWQADYLAGALLMPKQMINKYLEVNFGFKNNSNLKVEKYIVDELAKVFEVSKAAMMVRLKNLAIEVM
ncbi:ImmA/IrrE family metallo-endopeptidase [Streptococcus gallinaceus]|uniref:ImmA/IrrE family metallo-endopeptidase n=1 Tax=Streptococcus gallinaceus TaxID=165758 RepID=UPI00209C803F|nr:ImmA/IrrE family metallo-endopeptidase [Streptococcus gallinaceus]